MPSIDYTAPDGTVTTINMQPGQDPAQVVAEFEQATGISQAPQAATPSLVDDLPELPSVGDVPNMGTGIPDKGILESIGDRLGVVGDFARGTMRDITGADADPNSSLEQAQRGAGLGVRTVTGAVPKAATGIADLAGTILNVPIAGLDKLGQLVGDEPLDARIPTNNTAQLDAMLSEVFPTPETISERIVGTGGEMALTGGLASAALAPKAGSLASSPSTQGILRNLGDDIGGFFAKTPVKASLVEGGGGLGAATGQELSQEAELGPTGQMLATLAGGIAGGFTPQGVTNLSRRAATGIQNVADSAFSGELRAARALQDAAADPEAAARAALDAPEGVLPARAADEPNVRAMESKTLAEDPAAAQRAARDLEAAESGTIRELSEGFGPTTNKEAWQQEVIARSAPDDVEIRIGQPDEMLDDAFNGFTRAYDDVADIPISTQNLQVEGGNVSLREMFGEATAQKGIIADDKWRTGVQKFLDGLLDDLNAAGTPVGPADSGVAQVSSQDLLTLRSQIRAQQRARAQAGTRNPRAAAEADMLGAANRAVTDVLESQLDDASATALRATDARYRDYLTTQDAILRSGDKGLTPEALRASLKSRETASNVARGRTGELGRLAEQGRDVARTLGDPQAAARITRNMTPEQLQAAKADYNRALVDKATPTDGTLRGKKYLEQLDQNTDTLTAAGFSQAEIDQMRTVGRQLQMIQSRSPGAVQALLEDDVGNIMRLAGAIAGSKAGSRILKLLGGAGGAGPSLIVSQFGSKSMQNTLTSLSVDRADAMIRAAMTDRELFAALMTHPTANIKAQADAARTIQAWLARTTSDETEDE